MIYFNLGLSSYGTFVFDLHLVFQQYLENSISENYFIKKKNQLIFLDESHKSKDEEGEAREIHFEYKQEILNEVIGLDSIITNLMTKLEIVCKTQKCTDSLKQIKINLQMLKECSQRLSSKTDDEVDDETAVEITNEIENMIQEVQKATNNIIELSDKKSDSVKEELTSLLVDLKKIGSSLSSHILVQDRVKTPPSSPSLDQQEESDLPVMVVESAITPPSSPANEQIESVERSGLENVEELSEQESVATIDEKTMKHINTIQKVNEQTYKEYSILDEEVNDHDLEADTSAANGDEKADDVGNTSQKDGEDEIDEHKLRAKKDSLKEMHCKISIEISEPESFEKNKEHEVKHASESIEVNGDIVSSQEISDIAETSAKANDEAEDKDEESDVKLHTKTPPPSPNNEEEENLDSNLEPNKLSDSCAKEENTEETISVVVVKNESHVDTLKSTENIVESDENGETKNIADENLVIGNNDEEDFKKESAEINYAANETEFSEKQSDVTSELEEKELSVKGESEACTSVSSDVSFGLAGENLADVKSERTSSLVETSEVSKVEITPELKKAFSVDNTSTFEEHKIEHQEFAKTENLDLIASDVSKDISFNEPSTEVKSPGIIVDSTSANSTETDDPKVTLAIDSPTISVKQSSVLEKDQISKELKESPKEENTSVNALNEEVAKEQAPKEDHSEQDSNEEMSKQSFNDNEEETQNKTLESTEEIIVDHESKSEQVSDEDVKVGDSKHEFNDEDKNDLSNEGENDISTERNENKVKEEIIEVIGTIEDIEKGEKIYSNEDSKQQTKDLQAKDSSYNEVEQEAVVGIVEEKKEPADSINGGEVDNGQADETKDNKLADNDKENSDQKEEEQANSGGFFFNIKQKIGGFFYSAPAETLDGEDENKVNNEDTDGKTQDVQEVKAKGDEGNVYNDKNADDSFTKDETLVEDATNEKVEIYSKTETEVETINEEEDIKNTVGSNETKDNIIQDEDSSKKETKDKNDKDSVIQEPSTDQEDVNTHVDKNLDETLAQENHTNDKDTQENNENDKDTQENDTNQEDTQENNENDKDTQEIYDKDTQENYTSEKETGDIGEHDSSSDGDKVTEKDHSKFKGAKGLKELLTEMDTLIDEKEIDKEDASEIRSENDIIIKEEKEIASEEKDEGKIDSKNEGNTVKKFRVYLI